MATLKQVCDIVDDALRLPAPTARWHAQRLQAAGLLPTTPGVPAHASSSSAATLVLSVLVGSSLAHDFAALRLGSGGPNLASALGTFLEGNRDLVELTIDRASLSASIDFHENCGAIDRVRFYADQPHAPPAFDCTIRVAGDVFKRIRQAIAEAPEVRSGRRPIRP